MTENNSEQDAARQPEGASGGARPEGEQPSSQGTGAPRDPEGARLPLVLRIMGVLSLLGGLAALGDAVPVVISFVQTIGAGTYKVSSLVIFGVLVALLMASAVLFVFLGVRLLRNKRAHAAVAANTLAAITVTQIIATMMLYGLSPHHIGYLVQLVILIALTSYLDPSLVEERKLQRKLKKMDKDQAAEEKRLAKERKPKKGFIALNFFNLFWIFVVCCVLGLIIEVIFHFIVFHEYQDRAGMLFGPFSPIYGFGATLMTIALNRFYDKPVWVIFLVSAVIGGAFEFFTSWIMEFAFGIRAWDYSGSFLSIDGRTNFVFMVAWGVLGLAWIKLLLPQLLKLINLIPWKWRYSVTAVCTVLMLVNGVMTIQSLDCWYQRMAGQTPSTPIEQFYAKHFDSEYMQNRFQTMEMNPADSARADV
ncbi:putative ABC transporter permease [Gordonibacter sp.]|uniref:putative ABC transporter permease n=1 Tax=Gordonibacter sp. TaxID=1968902 RepID=UPI002FC73270